MYDPPQTLPLPKLINLLTDPKEERDVAAKNPTVIAPAARAIAAVSIGSSLRPDCEIVRNN
jgi:hypothetical protein